MSTPTMPDNFAQSAPGVGQPGGDSFALAAAMGSAPEAGFGSPTLIGDFFGTGTGVTNVTLSFNVDPTDSGVTRSFQFATAEDLAAGQDFNAIDPAGFGVIVTSRQSLGDVLNVGDSGSISAGSIRPPISTLRIQSTASIDEINAAIASGGQVAAAEPLSNSDIMLRIRNGIVDNAPEFTGAYDNVADFIDIRLNPESTLTVTDTSSSFLVTTNYIYDVSIALPTPSPGELVGRANLTDNNSPFPRDRVFFDFNYFHNAAIGSLRFPANRFSPGIEKTFLNEQASVELRVPMAVTLTSSVVTDSDDLLSWETGDVVVGVKTLLCRDRYGAVAAGLGVSVPTADDFTVDLGNGTPILRIENRTVRLLPYLASVYTPTRCHFFQLFASVDTDTSGNPVFYNRQGLVEGTGGALVQEGVLQSASIARVQFSAGRWIFRNRCRYRCRGLSDLATVVEAHWSNTFTGFDRLDTDRLAIGGSPSASVLNLTLGAHMFYGPHRNLTVGYGFPVTEDRGFDGELRLYFNRYF